MVTLLSEGKSVNIQNLKRFREDYGPGEEGDKAAADKLSRAEDFHETFRGDSSEDFKIGLKLSKGSLKVRSYTLIECTQWQVC